MNSEQRRSAPDPYRVLFPLGVIFAIGGATPWVLYALGRVGWPGPLHAALMIEGFELCFVLGFLLTAIPGFTHGERCTPVELAGAVAGPLAFGLCLALGRDAAALAVFVLTLFWLVLAVSRRVVGAKLPPAEEFLFVGVGLALGIAGGVAQLGAALGWWNEPAPRFGLHVVSLGMVLALVLGVGSLLVPVFAAIRDPLAISGVAGPHARRGRRPLYAALALAIVLSFITDALALAHVGALLRALVATVFVALVWKLTRLPGRRALVAWAMWASGWLVVLGLWLAAAFPLHAIPFQHLVFMGGYGLLTLAIGSRVVVGHGRYPVTDESRLLSALVVIAMALALGLRVAADWLPPRAQSLAYATSAVLWIVAWLAWSAGAMPRIAAVRGGPSVAPKT